MRIDGGLATGDVVSGALAPGHEVLPGYRVVRLVGRGGRVDTYEVDSEQRDCRCVVKTVRPDAAHDPAARDALVLEGTLLKELSHPHLARAYEVLYTPVPAVVLELLPGSGLAKLAATRRLSASEVLTTGRQLVSALSYLHTLGWVHQDLKPANVVVGRDRTVLIDLSLVVRIGTRADPQAGTRGYLAPEQVHAGPVTPATDVWGLGVTLAECLTGELPYGDEPSWQSAPRRFPLPRQPQRVPTLTGVTGPLRELLDGCLRLDPAERPTLPEVRDRLTALL
jgi:serine/threonine protein kinase